jgi:hypothetical protein
MAAQAQQPAPSAEVESSEQNVRIYFECDGFAAGVCDWCVS